MQTVREEASSQLLFVFVASSFVSFVRSILSVDFGARGLADDPWVEYGQSMCSGWSAGRWQMVCYLWCATGGSCGFLRQSARAE
jgi:hypothetical protein